MSHLAEVQNCPEGQCLVPSLHQYACRRLQLCPWTHLVMSPVDMSFRSCFRTATAADLNTPPLTFSTPSASIVLAGASCGGQTCTHIGWVR